MNYYEHHLGDWAAATGHLSWDEDMAYTRLLRAYYHHEQAIAEGQQYRLARATTPAQRRAVDQVLSEFFEFRDGRYYQKRADAEIARFHAGEPERAAKKANETNRLKRHRDERAELFKRVTDAGEHAPWNIGITELRAIVKRLEETASPPLPETAPATPATATHTHTHTHTQTPEYKTVDSSGESTSTPPPPTPAGLVCARLRQAGVASVNPSHPRLLALIAAGMTGDEIADLAMEPSSKGKGFAWLLAAAEGRRREAAAIGELPPARASPMQRRDEERRAVIEGLTGYRSETDHGRIIDGQIVETPRLVG